MIQIISEKRKPSTAQMFQQAFANAGQVAANQIPEFLIENQNQKLQQQLREQEDEALQNMFGKSFSGIQDQKLRQEIVGQLLKGQQAQQTNLLQQQEKTAPLQAGLETIQEMRKLKATGHLGPKISQGLGLGLLSGDVRKHRAQYEQLGKSLISLASTIPIRNQQEFQTLAENLYDPTKTEAEIEGILDAMENVIKRNMGSGDIGYQEMSMEKQKSSERPPLSSFYR